MVPEHFRLEVGNLNGTARCLESRGTRVATVERQSVWWNRNSRYSRKRFLCALRTSRRRCCCQAVSGHNCVCLLSSLLLMGEKGTRRWPSDCLLARSKCAYRLRLVGNGPVFCIWIFILRFSKWQRYERCTVMKRNILNARIVGPWVSNWCHRF